LVILYQDLLESNFYLTINRFSLFSNCQIISILVIKVDELEKTANFSLFCRSSVIRVLIVWRLTGVSRLFIYMLLYNMGKCPHCLKDVSDSAQKCKHCWKWI